MEYRELGSQMVCRNLKILITLKIDIKTKLK